MSGFQFRFAKVLEVKEYRKQHAEEAYQVSLEEWRAAQQRVEQCSHLAELARAQIAASETLTVGQLEEAVNRAKWWSDRLVLEEHHARLLAGKVEEARRQLINAVKEEKMMEKLQDKHMEDYHANENTVQQKLLDDLSNIAHVRSMRDNMRFKEITFNGGQ